MFCWARLQCFRHNVSMVCPAPYPILGFPVTLRGVPCTRPWPIFVLCPRDSRFGMPLSQCTARVGVSRNASACSLHASESVSIILFSRLTAVSKQCNAHHATCLGFLQHFGMFLPCVRDLFCLFVPLDSRFGTTSPWDFAWRTTATSATGSFFETR